MSESVSHFRAIANRRQSIDAEIDKLRLQIQELEEESRELEIAAKVLSRLGQRTDSAEPELPLTNEDVGEKTTIVQKIKSIVAELQAAGVRGVSSGQILAEMSKRYSVTDPNIVRPTLWRMVKGNTLIKEDELYYLTIHPEPGAPRS